MWILKQENDGYYRKIYWTLDGAHICRIQQIPLNSPKDGNPKKANRTN